MALTTTPTHPDADSYVTLAEATALLANRSDVTEWAALTDDQKEALLKLATQHVDTLRFFHKKVYRVAQDYRREQNLEFPRDNHHMPAGVVDSATSTTIVDDALANLQNYPDDYFNGWAVVIKEGTGKGQVVKVTDFAMATGTLTVETMSTVPDTTSQYRLVPEIPEKVKRAVVEQAIYISKGGGDRARLQAEGVTEYKIGDLMEKFGGSSMRSGKVPISDEARGYLTGLITRLGKLI